MIRNIKKYYFLRVTIYEEIIKNCGIVEKKEREYAYSSIYYLNLSVSQLFLEFIPVIRITLFERSFIAITTSMLFRPGWTCPAAHQSESLLG